MKKLQAVRGGAGDITVPKEGVRPQDNLYLAVNAAWIKKAKIPADKPSTGSFNQIAENVEKTLMQDFADFDQGKKTLPAHLPEFKSALAFYQLAKDFDQRNQEGAQPLQADLAILTGLRDFSDFNLKAADLDKAGLSIPINFYVDYDMKNTKINVLQNMGPQVFLPDTKQYGTPTGQKLLEVFKAQSEKLLQMVGLSQADAQKYVADALAFDAKVAKVVKSNEEWADYPAMYNPLKWADFAAKFKSFKIDYYIKELLGETPKRIIVNDPKFLAHAESLLNAESFDGIKGWMIVNFVNGVAGFLSQDFREASFPYHQALYGQKELASQEKNAYQLANGLFGEVVGIYYGRTYFGADAKADVLDMIHKMLSVYEKRLSENTWLSKATKQKAIVKLRALVLKIGYPEKVEEIYKRYKITPASQGGTLYANERAAEIERFKYNLEQLHREVDRTLWAMPGNLVNACYDPARNDLTFPAAILQKPFYDLTQSRSANYGGIGVVIAHEVSHAFDNNGAQFDEFGNMVNWWTKGDFAEFKKRTQKDIALFDGLTYGPGTLNGKQIVSENVADQGGLSAAVEAAKGESGSDFKALFENFARVWAAKQSTQVMTTLLAIDVHAPGPLRANVQSQCQDEFYKAFDVQPGDGMYLAPEERVHIW